MLKRKLLIINIAIITLTLAIIAFSSIMELRYLLYRENTLTYNNLILQDVNELQDIFDSCEDKLLTICSNRELQNLLEVEEYDYYRIEETAESLKLIVAADEVQVLPVFEDDVYYPNASQNGYSCYEEGLFDYNISNTYTWKCRPDNKDCIRVIRPMFSLNDLSKVIAIVSVDYSFPRIVDMVYSFGTADNMKGKMYFLDENNEFILPYHYSGTLELKEGNEFISFDNPLPEKATYTLVHTFKNNNWKLVAVVEGSSLYVDSSNRITVILLSTLALELIGIILTAYFINRLTKPIVNLSDRINDAAQSETYAHIEAPENVTKEVKNLYDSYNNLADEVNNSIRNIQEFSKKEVENQFMLLQAQINPHFLYNTLSSVSWMAANHQDDDIQKIVIDLVNLFRISLNSGKPMIPLEKEFEHVRSYLEIMKYRYPDSYDVEYDMAENTRDLIVIKQILQPLAENALNHGFLEENIHGLISIKSFIEGDYLVLSLSNTGSKVDLEIVEKLLNNDEELSKKHYGIRNVNERLKMYYGENSGLSYRIEDEKTVVEIRLPLEKTREDINE
ncbi:MAG: histidine kinase [Erysipelotrichaceae bacterium]|nr:histidine kinase [Erysipelotrichaceae bacterium]